MIIANLDYRLKAPVTGEFRVRGLEQRKSDNGVPYLTFTIEDYSGALTAISWSKNFPDAVESADFDCISLQGQLKAFQGQWQVDVATAELLQHEPEHPVHLIPVSMAPQQSNLEQLGELYDYISHPVLKQFIGWVLADTSIVFPFISLPASRQHHHSEAGGLLDHSLECASIVSRSYEFPEHEIELATVAALFHDVGKIRTLQGVGKLTSAGHILDHDAMTLEVLAPYLQRLDSICPDAGLALRYMWTWRNHQRGHRPPLLTIVEVLTAADRISSGLNRQQTAFSEHPEWHQFASLGEHSSFWRPRLMATG